MVSEIENNDNIITSYIMAGDEEPEDPEVMKKETKRLCMPKVNHIVERKQFHKIKQGENETIYNFESQVRANAQSSEFGRGCKGCPCICFLFKTNWEEDESNASSCAR